MYVCVRQYSCVERGRRGCDRGGAHKKRQSARFELPHSRASLSSEHFIKFLYDDGDLNHKMAAARPRLSCGTGTVRWHCCCCCRCMRDKNAIKRRRQRRCLCFCRRHPQQVKTSNNKKKRKKSRRKKNKITKCTQHSFHSCPHTHGHSDRRTCGWALSHSLPHLRSAPLSLSALLRVK